MLRLCYHSTRGWSLLGCHGLQSGRQIPFSEGICPLQLSLERSPMSTLSPPTPIQVVCELMAERSESGDASKPDHRTPSSVFVASSSAILGVLGVCTTLVRVGQHRLVHFKVSRQLEQQPLLLSNIQLHLKEPRPLLTLPRIHLQACHFFLLHFQRTVNLLFHLHLHYSKLRNLAFCKTVITLMIELIETNCSEANENSFMRHLKMGLI